MRGKGGRTRYSEIVRGLRNAIGVDFDWQEQRIYWTDVLTDKIQRAKFDGSQVETVVSGGLISAEGVNLIDQFSIVKNFNIGEETKINVHS